MLWLLAISECVALVVVSSRGVRLPAFCSWLVFGILSCLFYDPFSPWKFTLFSLAGFALRLWVSMECVRLILPARYADLLSLIVASGFIGGLLFLSVAMLVERDYGVGVMLSVYLSVVAMGIFWTMIGTAWVYANVQRDARLWFAAMVGLEFLVVALARLSSGHWALWQSATIAARAVLICGSGYLAQRFHYKHNQKYQQHANRLY